MVLDKIPITQPTKSPALYFPFSLQPLHKLTLGQPIPFLTHSLFLRDRPRPDKQSFHFRTTLAQLSHPLSLYVCLSLPCVAWPIQFGDLHLASHTVTYSTTSIMQELTKGCQQFHPRIWLFTHEGQAMRAALFIQRVLSY